MHQDSIALNYILLLGIPQAQCSRGVWRVFREQIVVMFVTVVHAVVQKCVVNFIVDVRTLLN